jgi:flagellar hook-associated protein 2
MKRPGAVRPEVERMVELNFSNIALDSQGRVSFSGLSSGIDFQTAVDGIIAARQLPVDTLKTTVSDNEAKITAYKDLQSLLNSLKSAVDSLRGAVSFNNTSDVFLAKQVFASTSRLDGVTPSSAGALLGVTVDATASAGNHTIEIQRIATSHKVSSDAFTSTSTALGLTDGDIFTIGGGTNTTQITVSSTDTLQDLRDRINNANTGTTPTEVTATIVSVGTTQNFLVLTADKTGKTMTLTDNTGTPLQTLGILDGSAAIKHQLITPQSARLTADGLIDADRYESNFFTNSTTLLNTLATGATYPGSFDLTVGADTVTVNYTASDTLSSLVTDINTAITTAGAGNAVFDAGTSASLVTDGDGVRLVITNTSTATITTTDTNGLLAGLGVDNALVITRDSNTISDLFAGVTLDLFGAEEGTNIAVDIDRDLSGVKTAIQGFVTAYNAVKVFINQNALVDTDGQKADDAGILFGSRTLADVAGRLSLILGSGTTGVNEAFSVLAQVGVNLVDNSALTDSTLKDTLEIDDSTLDASLLNSIDDVRKLFAFNFSSSDPRAVLLDFTGTTTYDSSGYTLNIDVAGPLTDSSASVNLSTAFLNDGTDSFGATTSGTLQINGTNVAYNVATDTLDSLAANITSAGISGVTATVETDSGGSKYLKIDSTTTALTVTESGGGDLLPLLSLTGSNYTLASANIGGAASGADDGTATVSGLDITVTSSSGAEGLRLFYNGTADVSGISLDFSVGVGAQLFFEIDSLLDTNGAVESEISALEDQNKLANERIDEMLERLEIERQSLLERFISMETAIANAQSILDSIKQTTDALFASSS